MDETVLLVSGGLDSFLASRLLPHALRVFVDYGQPYFGLEERAVDVLHPDVRKVRISGLPWDPNDDYVPARNMMLATVGLRFGTRICLAGVRDELCADKSPEAFREMSVILNKHARGRVLVFSPLWGHTKAEAVHEYLGRGGDPGSLKETVSCYGTGPSSCFDCQSCFRRWAALASCGVETPRPSDRIIRDYGLRNLHMFPQSRLRSVLSAVGNVRLFDLAEASSDRSLTDGLDGFVVLTSASAPVPGAEHVLTQSGIRHDAVLWNFHIVPPSEDLPDGP